MRFFKLAFISLIILFLVLLGLSALIPSHVRISRAIDIQTSQSPQQFVADFSKWKQWNKFVQHNDTSLSIQIVSVTADSVASKWRQGNGKEFESRFVFLKGPNHTTVQWYFDFHLRWYPWEKFQSIIYDKEMGPPMEQSLSKLKQITEAL